MLNKQGWGSPGQNPFHWKSVHTISQQHSPINASVCETNFHWLIKYPHIFWAHGKYLFVLETALQTENLNQGEAIELTDAAKHILLERRGNVEELFREIFKTLNEICDDYDKVVRKSKFAP